jgi:hypothetical protein
MKKGILFLLLVSSVVANAQSLKEALFSGKLKNTPGTVIRKGDDLSSKMDTAAHKTPTTDTLLTKAPVLTIDASTIKVTPQTDSAAVSAMERKDSPTTSVDTAALGVTANAAKETAPAPKDNTAMWKEYMNAVISSLKTEALPSKKVKRETYYILVSYAIGTDGQVTVNDVSVTPENGFLQQQVKDRITSDAPRLNPVPSSSGTPHKVNKKYSFTLTKE